MSTSRQTARHRTAPPRDDRPGSDGEHLVQRRMGTTERADRFYDEQVLDRLNFRMRAFVARQEMFFLATADRHGSCDNTFRAGPPGFLHVLDDVTLAYPEYRGNGVHASLGNMEENPPVGILMVDFLRDRIGLHVNGRARTVPDDLMRRDHPWLPADEVPGRRALVWVVVTVEEAYIHCAKHIPHLQKAPRGGATGRAWGTDDPKRKGGDFFGAAADAATRRPATPPLPAPLPEAAPAAPPLSTRDPLHAAAPFPPPLAPPDPLPAVGPPRPPLPATDPFLAAAPLAPPLAPPDPLLAVRPVLPPAPAPEPPRLATPTRPPARAIPPAPTAAPASVVSPARAVPPAPAMPPMPVAPPIPVAPPAPGPVPSTRLSPVPRSRPDAATWRAEVERTLARAERCAGTAAHISGGAGSDRAPEPFTGWFHRDDSA
ncbi:pyridoxamine 5'-phosphate oxidase family protein [Streptomyces sp. NPDC048330]|uniref:pyridoxamine 5'-phosphate oxidase family protein n=1 Tax=Streptomyces sp. NPDC048330 TaxID=3365533 RepID=UPI0037229449